MFLCGPWCFDCTSLSPPNSMSSLCFHFNSLLKVYLDIIFQRNGYISFNILSRIESFERVLCKYKQESIPVKCVPPARRTLPPTRCQHPCGGGPQVNKFEQVSSFGYQTLVAGGSVRVLCSGDGVGALYRECIIVNGHMGHPHPWTE